MSTGRVSKKSKYRRVLLKLSGEVLREPGSSLSIDPKACACVAGQIERALRMGAQIAIVLGGGNIIRGAAGGHQGISRITDDYMGMLATVINALAIKDALRRTGIEAALQSAVAVDRFAEPVVAERAISELENGRVVIFAGGTGNPFLTTDTAAALRANEIGADVLLKATNVDGIYDSDPRSNANAVKYGHLTYAEALSRRLKIMDAAAFFLCMESRIPIIVFDFFKAGNFQRVLSGARIGSVVS